MNIIFPNSKKYKSIKDKKINVSNINLTKKISLCNTYVYVVKFSKYLAVIRFFLCHKIFFLSHSLSHSYHFFHIHKGNDIS